MRPSSLVYRAMRGPGESYSDVFLRLVAMEGACGPVARLGRGVLWSAHG